MSGPTPVDQAFRPAGTMPAPGRFYADPTTAFSYYCESTSKNEARFLLVESYDPNTGSLIQATVTMRFEEGAVFSFLEVVCEEEIKRLHEIYKVLIRKR